MCLIIYKKKQDIIIPSNIIDQTAVENRDGFGVTYLDTLQTYRTMDYKKAEEMLLAERPLIAHYRYATRGEVGKGNCHPFKFSKGWLFSNGTVDGLGSQTVCDTKVVAGLLEKTPRKYWANLLAMTSTRFAVVDKSGKVELHGKWVEQAGVLYSKDVAVRKVTFGGYSSSSKGRTTQTPADWTPKADYDSRYWEVTSVNERIAYKKDGEAKLQEWFAAKQSTTTNKYVDEVEEPEDDYTPYEGGAVYEYDAAGYDALCAELGQIGLDYDTGFGAWVECSDGEIYDTSSGSHIPMDFAAELSITTLDFVLGVEDPYSSDEDYPVAVAAPDSWEGNHLVAVYGTLKRGRANHHIMWRMGHFPRFVGNGLTDQRLRMERCGVPFVYPGESPDGNNIVVEVYELAHKDQRHAVDSLEGHPKFYTRRQTDITLENGTTVKAWLYFIENDQPSADAKFIASF